MFTQIQCLTQIQIVYSNQREIHKASIFLKNKNKRLLKLRMIQEKKIIRSLNFYSTESFIIPTSIIQKHHEQFPPNYRGLELMSPAP